MTWKIDYTDTAVNQLRKLDKSTARRVVDYMDIRVAASDPHNVGRALTGPLGKLWRYRMGNIRVVCDIQANAKRVLVLRIAQRDKAYR